MTLSTSSPLILPEAISGTAELHLNTTCYLKWCLSCVLKQALQGVKPIICFGHATRLYQDGVDEQLIMENTGHRSVHGVRSYKRTSSDQKKALSEILNVGGNPESSSAVTNSSQNNLKLTASEAIKGFTFNNYTDIYISIHLDHS